MTPLVALALAQVALACVCAYFLLVPALLIWAGTRLTTACYRLARWLGYNPNTPTRLR